MQKILTLDLLNRTEEITIDEVRSLETFKEWNDEQIIELLKTLKMLSQIMYNNWSKQAKTGKVIALDIKNQVNIAA